MKELKIYEYDSKRYFFAVKAPTIFMIIILVYSLIINIKNPGINIYSLCMIICIYGIFNNLVSLSNPKRIIDEEKEIKFFAFGKFHSYKWEEIKYIRIKEFYNKRIYLRIDNPKLTSGRYWIKTKMYNKGEELYIKLKELEKQIHPELLQFRKRKA